MAWITGASSGIGKHVAYQLARVGCKLVLSARNTAELENIRKHCLSLYSYTLACLQLQCHIFCTIIYDFSNCEEYGLCAEYVMFYRNTDCE